MGQNSAYNCAIMFSNTQQEQIKNLAEQLNLPVAFSALLVNRGIRSKDDCESFLKSSYQPINEPIKHIQEASQLLVKSVSENSHIVIYADCTISGFLNGAVIYSFLSYYIKSIRFIIPNRISDGYGINLQLFDQNIYNHTDLIYFQSCDFKSEDDYKEFKKKYSGAIIISHLSNENSWSEVELNSDSFNSNTIKLFRLLEIIDEEMNSNNLSKVMSLLSISVMNDRIKLVGIARYIVSYSYKRNDHSIKLFAELEKQIPDYLRSQNKIASIVNSNLILAKNDLLIAAFLSASEQKAKTYTDQLLKNHQIRLNIAFKKYKRVAKLLETKQFVAAELEEKDSNYFTSIAMNLSSKYQIPAIVYHNSKTIEGSVYYDDKYLDLRAIANSCNALSTKGHRNSFSFKIKSREIDSFFKMFEKKLTQIEKEKKYEYQLDLDLIDSRLIRLIKLLEPFGYGNVNPVFLAKNVRVVGSIKVLKQKHLKFNVQQDKNVIEAIAFNLSDDYDWVLSKRSSLAFRFQLNEVFWAGKKSLQLIIKGFDSIE